QSDPKMWALLNGNWFGAHNQLMADGNFRGLGGLMRNRAMLGAPGGFGGGMAPGAPMPQAAAFPLATETKEAAKHVEVLAKTGDKAPAKEGGGAAPARVREYFPETMLWQPALITDDKGMAVLPLTFADSITTWRLSASASSRGGALGGVTAPLRVFQ